MVVLDSKKLKNQRIWLIKKFEGNSRMWKFLLTIRKPIEKAYLYWNKISANINSKKYKDFFKDINTFVIFIGYPRSGHTLVGSLLDAHPNMLIANEKDVFKYLNCNKEELYYLLYENSVRFAKNREWTKYSYTVPNEWQGNFKKIFVIGDKSRGGRSSRLLGFNPNYYKKLENILGTEIDKKIIHVIRNPFDNITTMARGGNLKKKKATKERLRSAIDRYFDLVEDVNKVKKNKELEIYDLKLEDLINNPKYYLKDLCRFLNMDASKKYLKNCEKVIFSKPKKTRYEGGWDNKLINRVNERIKKYSFLRGYSFEN